MSSEQLTQATPEILARLMAAGASHARLWKPEELGAVFRHQMSAVIQFDVAGLDQGLANQIATLSAAEGLLVRSFADLFQHPHPPVELLILTKQFAKANIGHPASALPDEIAKVLYYVSIAVALVRCGQRITELDDRALRQGLEWAVGRSWLDAGVRDAFRRGLEELAQAVP